MTTNDDPYGLIYKPGENSNAKKLPPGFKETGFCVKFSNDAFIGENYLKDKNIPYDPSELEDTPLGRCLRVKNKKNEEKDD